MSLLVRVTSSDLDRYISLEKTRANLATYKSMTDPAEALEQITKSINFFIQIHDQVVGTVSYRMISKDTAEIDGVLITPEYEGSGYAKSALKELLQELQNIPHVFLMTHPKNPRSIHLYEGLGFKSAEIVQDYFGDGEPRMKMVLALS